MKLILLMVLIMVTNMEAALFGRISGRKGYLRSMQRPSWDLNTANPNVQGLIVNLHNFLRTRVNPPASNMLEMHWNDEAASRAQAWALQCQFLQHDHDSNRYVENYGNCGQNIFVSTHPFSWEFAINKWYSEHMNFTYGWDYNNLEAVGHYTQMVWATTHQVGCFFTRCPYGDPHGRGYYTYVCNYCPTGNWETKYGTPYKIGEPCGDCPYDCQNGKLCTNSCPYVDLWSNCRRIAIYGMCSMRYDYCKATCGCGDRLIHEWN